MAYYTTANTGKGFITHADNESAHVSGWPGDVWVTENSTWAARVGATEIKLYTWQKNKKLRIWLLQMILNLFFRF
jgi:hypothetical protein